MQQTPHTLPYVERDESWMYFNHRLLVEAMREDIPLLERFNYLGIYSNNLDEFFRVRIASLLRTIRYTDEASSQERQTARETLLTVARLNKEYSQTFEQTLRHLINLLDAEHIHIVNERELTPAQEREVIAYYREHLVGVTNPIYPDSPTFSPEQDLRDKLYLATVLTSGSKTQQDVALIEIPSGEQGRFVRLSDVDGDSYLMLLDDVIRFCMPYIFSGMGYTEYKAYTFKLTKDAEIEIEVDLGRSVIEKISQGVKRRKRGEPIRLVYDASMSPFLLEHLSHIAELDSQDTSIGGGRYHNMKDLMHLPDCGRTNLRFEKHPPLQFLEQDYERSILSCIFEKDMGIHFPYQSFNYFLRILREAAMSKEVTEIRISIYRLAQNSKVIKALKAAAQNGKRVTAVVELLARFDEQSNIHWSKTLQESGVNVIFGHEKLKVHSKLVHITTRQGEIACIGSGNLHEGTACLYTDFMLVTARPSIATDVRRVFDFIERPFLNIRFRELLVSPNEMRRKLLFLINREIRAAHRGEEAYIRIKINHIVDREMVYKLYEASQAGVQVDLCVRGNCSVVPEVPGISERIRINAILGRYLEHSRIYIFANAGNPLYFIGSTDWMPRNLDKRIEVMSPVYDPDLQQDLARIVDWGLQDTAQGYYVNIHHGVPRRNTTPHDKLFNSQEALYQLYHERQRQVQC